MLAFVGRVRLELCELDVRKAAQVWGGEEEGMALSKFIGRSRSHVGLDCCKEVECESGGMNSIGRQPALTSSRISRFFLLLLLSSLSLLFILIVLVLPYYYCYW